MKKLLLFSFASLTVIGSTAFAQSEDDEQERSPQCGGVERWSIKVFTDNLANTIDYTPKPTSIAYLVAKPRPFISDYYTLPRYQPIEDSTYSVTCNITIKKTESDNDYHLVLSDGVHTMIGEIPDPACSAASTSPKVAQFTSARAWVDANIASGNVYNVNLPLVVVTGVAFLDTAHGQTGAAPNQLELHSILDIHFVTATGIPTLDAQLLSVNIFPNPSKENFKISVSSKTADLNKCSLRLYDINGRQVSEYNLPVTAHKEISATINSKVPLQWNQFHPLGPLGFEPSK